MKKADELIKLVREDLSLEGITDISINNQVSIARDNFYCKQLTMLARNSSSAAKNISDAIYSMASDSSNDFRILSLIIVLSDAGSQEAIDLSSYFLQRNDLSKTRSISISILLKESLYGTEY